MVLDGLVHILTTIERRIIFREMETCKGNKNERKEKYFHNVKLHSNILYQQNRKFKIIVTNKIVPSFKVYSL